MCVESFGSMIESLGPTMQVCDLKKTIGCSGMGALVSFAWST